MGIFRLLQFYLAVQCHSDELSFLSILLLFMSIMIINLCCQL